MVISKTAIDNLQLTLVRKTAYLVHILCNNKYSPSLHNHGGKKREKKAYKIERKKKSWLKNITE